MFPALLLEISASLADNKERGGLETPQTSEIFRGWIDCTEVDGGHCLLDAARN
jgi:hypothetical protein